jgi:hypothetical protein
MKWKCDMAQGTSDARFIPIGASGAIFAASITAAHRFWIDGQSLAIGRRERFVPSFL